VGTNPTAIAAADFNGDGKLDVLTANSASNTVSLLTGKGNGSLLQPPKYQITVSDCFVTPPVFAVGDWNGDGLADLISVGDGKVCMLNGTGSGTFGAPREIADIRGTHQGVVLADFNGDGKLDIAVTGANQISVVLQGSGSEVHGYPAGGSPLWLTQGDFNGDGVLDLVTANGDSQTLSVFLGRSDGTFENALLYSAGGTTNYVAVGDFNGDGHLDLICTLSTPGLALLLGNGDGTFQEPQILPLPSAASSLAVGDFNNDGKLDVAATLATAAEVSVMLGDGTGGFGPAALYAVGASPNSLIAADFNHDGSLDLVMVCGGENDFETLLGKGDGTFAAPTSGFFAAPNPQRIAIGDFNGDGKPDVVEAGLSGYLLVLLNTTP
jgi:hypothetical protein